MSYIRLPLPCTWVIIFMSCKSWLKQWTLIIDCVVIIFNLIKFVAAVKIIHFTTSDQNRVSKHSSRHTGRQEGAQVFKSCIGWPKVSNTINQSSYRNKILETAKSPKRSHGREHQEAPGQVCVRITSIPFVIALMMMPEAERKKTKLRAHYLGDQDVSDEEPWNISKEKYALNLSKQDWWRQATLSSWIINGLGSTPALSDDQDLKKDRNEWSMYELLTQLA